MEGTTAAPGALAATDYGKQIEERYIALKRSRIRVAGDARTTRASSIGHPCERFLYYERTANEMKTQHDEGLQSIFDLGNLDESFLLREFEEAGISIVQRGRDHFWHDLEISGHVDARLRIGGWPKSVIAEVKSLNPYTWATIQSADDVRYHKALWVRRWFAQVQTYLLLEGEEMGLLILLNKVTGQIRVVVVMLDYEYAESLLKKAEVVRDAVRAKVEPARVLGDQCDRCGFKHLCLPDRAYGPGIQVIDGPEAAEIEGLLKRRAALAEAAAEYKEVDDTVKGMLPKQAGEFIVGEFVVTQSETKRKGYSVAAGSYLRREVVRLSEKGDQS